MAQTPKASGKCLNEVESDQATERRQDERPTMRDLLVEKKKALQAGLRIVNKAIATLDGNPEAEKIYEIIRRARF